MSDQASHLDGHTRMERALRFLAENYTERPTLEEAAAKAGLSKFHFQREFTRWAGISPGRFMACLALDHAKALLAEAHNVLDSAYEAGLSGPGRLHDLFVTHEAVTPGEFKGRGAGLRMRYGFHSTPVGECAVLLTPRGICALAFVNGRGRKDTLAALQSGWERAEFSEQPRSTGAVAARLFSYTTPTGGRAGAPPHLLLRGTNFQVNVWKALLRIPSGAVVTYGAIAEHLGMPGAARAVGQAVARNPIAGLIPCHRVIRSLGLPGEYRWGAHRKRLLLAWEAAHALPVVESRSEAQPEAPPEPHSPPEAQSPAEAQSA